MKSKVFVLGLIAVVGLIAIGTFHGQRADNPVTASADQQQNDKEIVRQRALNRWNSIIEGDYDAAYMYETPSYRAVNDLKTFMTRFAGQVARNKVEVISVEYVDGQPELLEVTIKMDFQTLVFGRVLESVNYDKESWTKLDGKWWYLPRN